MPSSIVIKEDREKEDQAYQCNDYDDQAAQERAENNGTATSFLMLNEQSVNVDMETSRNQANLMDSLNESSKDQSNIMAVDEGIITTAIRSGSPDLDTKY